MEKKERSFFAGPHFLLHRIVGGVFHFKRASFLSKNFAFVISCNFMFNTLNFYVSPHFTMIIPPELETSRCVSSTYAAGIHTSCTP